MTIGGWVFMAVSVGSVWFLVAWCFYRLFSKRLNGREFDKAGEDFPERTCLDSELETVSQDQASH